MNTVTKQKLNSADAESIGVAVVTSFYMRHPEVEQAIANDSYILGSLSKETNEMIWAAIQRDT